MLLLSTDLDGKGRSPLQKERVFHSEKLREKNKKEKERLCLSLSKGKSFYLPIQ